MKPLVLPYSFFFAQIMTRAKPISDMITVEIAGGTLTSGSWKNLLASASAKRLLCIPVSKDSVLCNAFTSGALWKSEPLRK